MKKKKSKEPFAHYLAMWGSICTGLVYAGIGVIAVLSFLKLKRGGADESSMLVYLQTFLIGRVFVWLILSGMVGYILWRVYETAKDPYGYGNDARGIMRRSMIALSSLADALIAYSAIQALFGFSGSEKTGEPKAERELGSSILESPAGSTILITAGVILLLIALTQVAYVITSAYRERLDIQRLKRWKQNIIHILAWTGHFARGIILGIIGFFLTRAGITKEPRQIVNTDKAFDFLGDSGGAVPFLLVAVGTVCYGVFMFFQGIYYDSDKK